jgi:phosphate transport system substrate-binding protein
MRLKFPNLFLIVCALFIARSVLALDINGAGSTAAMPLYVKWAEHYSHLEDTRLNYQGVGSSAGIKQIKGMAVNFGASDVALPAEDLKKEKLICFPSAISGVVPIVHLKGLKNGQLKLTGDILAGIFMHKITKWNDASITALNPDLHMPNADIVTVVRQDGSGTTYNFTDYLSRVSAPWKAGFGRDFAIKWPASAIAVKGSGGVSAMVRQTPGAIGYVDYNYVVQDHLTYVQMRNRDGRFVAPSPETFASALKNSGWHTKATFEEMLTDKPGNTSWPITMGTFIIVPQVAKDPESMIATLKFFSWAFMSGDQIVSGIDFVHLPDLVQARIFREMMTITDVQGNPLRWSIPYRG